MTSSSKSYSWYSKQLVPALMNAEDAHSIQYDEPTNYQSKKQLDIAIFYWSSSLNKLVVHHLDTYMMGHARGKEQAAKLE